MRGTTPKILPVLVIVGSGVLTEYPPKLLQVPAVSTLEGAADFIPIDSNFGPVLTLIILNDYRRMMKGFTGSIQVLEVHMMSSVEL